MIDSKDDGAVPRNFVATYNLPIRQNHPATLETYPRLPIRTDDFYLPKEDTQNGMKKNLD
jgi:hypothetical protein